MVANIGAINPSNGKQNLFGRVLSFGIVRDCCVVLCSGGDGIHKRGSGVRGGGAGGAAVPGPPLVLLRGLRPQVLR